MKKALKLLLCISVVFCGPAMGQVSVPTSITIQSPLIDALPTAFLIKASEMEKTYGILTLANRNVAEKFVTLQTAVGRGSGTDTRKAYSEYQTAHLQASQEWMRLQNSQKAAEESLGDLVEWIQKKATPQQVRQFLAWAKFTEATKLFASPPQGDDATMIQAMKLIQPLPPRQ